MAGDWMKITCDLSDKPEVHQMAGVLNIDPDAVVGKLIRVWSWFDKNTADGHAVGVTKALLDRLTFCDGFATAMLQVGWLGSDEQTLAIPNFDRHNGETAKSRALAQKRQQKSRSVTQVNTQVSRSERDKSVTREEKRREEKKEKEIPPKSPKGENEYTPEFEQAWMMYPPRPGANKKASFKAWNTRLKSGVPAERMIEGVKRYARYVDAARTNPQFIKQPASFFGPDEHFKSDWACQQSNGQHSGFEDMDYTQGVTEDGQLV